MVFSQNSHESFATFRACNSVFTALDHCHEAIEITSDDHVIQVRGHVLSLDIKREPFKSEPPFSEHFALILTFQHIFFGERNIKVCKEN